MFCKHCGKEIADESKYCKNCGGEVWEEPSASGEEPTELASSETKSDSAGRKEASRQRFVDVEEKLGEKRRSLFGAVSILLLFISLLFGALYNVRHHSEPSTRWIIEGNINLDILLEAFFFMLIPSLGLGVASVFAIRANASPMWARCLVIVIAIFLWVAWAVISAYPRLLAYSWWFRK